MNASNSADSYLGFSLLKTYDVAGCAAKCNAVNGCNSFNIYFERDPSKNPNDASCANPSSVVQIKCVTWGSAVTADNANNYGQWRGQFQVLVAGSNGYIKTAYATALANGFDPNNVPATSQDFTSAYTYDIYSGYDTNVGSYASAPATASYKDCETACDADSSCKAFTYVGKVGGIGSGTCWLKNKVGKTTSSGTNVVSGHKNPNALKIISAFWAWEDVTKYVSVVNGNIVINTTDFMESWGIGDPVGGWGPKTFNMLYTNGTTYRVFNAVDDTGIYTLSPSGADSAPNCVDAYLQPDLSTTSVFSVMWGKIQEPDTFTYDTWNGLLTSHNVVFIGDSLFGVDGWPWGRKCGVVWYTSDGQIKSKGFLQSWQFSFRLSD